MTKKAAQKKETRQTDRLQISVGFDDAVRALLATPPPPKPTKTTKKRVGKKTAKK